MRSIKMTAKIIMLVTEVVAFLLLVHLMDWTLIDHMVAFALLDVKHRSTLFVVYERMVFNLFMMWNELRVLVMAHHLVLNNRFKVMSWFMVYENWLVDLLMLHIAVFIFASVRVRIGVIEGLKDRVLVELNWLDIMLIIVSVIKGVMGLVVGVVLDFMVNLFLVMLNNRLMMLDFRREVELGIVD